MSIVLLNTAYLPPLSWWTCSLLGEKIWIDTDQTFQKQSFRNRANILTSNGLLNITVPVKQGANQAKTKEVLIDQGQLWQQIHWRTLCSSYNQSPYFQYIKNDLEHLLFNKENTLVDLNLTLIKYFLKIMKISVQITDMLTESELGQSTINCRVIGKKSDWSQRFKFKPYQQVFGQKFEQDLSIIDLFSCLGPESKSYLLDVAKSYKHEF